MKVENCEKCADQQTRRGPWYGIRNFYQPLLDLLAEVDIKRCEACGNVYRLSLVQCVACFVILAVISAITVFLAYTPLIPDVFSLLFAVLAYPLAMEIPRQYLPWKKVDDAVYYSHWKSRLGLILAHVLGIQLGCILGVFLRVGS